MSLMATRRAALDDGLKEQIRKRVQELLKEKGNGKAEGKPDAEPESEEVPGEEANGEGQEPESEEPSAGSIILFDEPSSKTARVATARIVREARVAACLVATDFPTQDALDAYLKKYPDADRSMHKVVEEKKGPSKKKGPGKKRKPGEDDEGKKRKPGEKEESSKGTPGKKEELVQKVKEKVKEKVQEKQKGPADEESGKKDPEQKDEQNQEEKPKPPEGHPAVTDEPHAKALAVKDQLIDMFGKDAKEWKVHKLNPEQVQKDVNVMFPDGTEKKYGDLAPEEKARVDKALDSGEAASKGVNDYTAVTTAAMKHNMANNLARHDDESVEETKLEVKEPATADNAAEVSSAIRQNASNLVRKYASALSKVSRPMAERYVNEMSDAVQEALTDSEDPLVGVSQADLDEFIREDFKRIIHQEVETRGRSLGDHGLRHVAGNVHSSMSMLNELQQHGVKVSGRQKLMAVTIMANHDMGYTVGDVAKDISKGKQHVTQSKALADQESERYDKIFGPGNSKKIREVIATHDSTDIDWDKDPMASAVRLADNTALFGEDKVQDLFIRSPKAMDLVGKLNMVASEIPPKPSEPKREKFESDEAFGEAKTKYDVKKKDYDEQMADPDVQKRIGRSRELQKSIKTQLHDVVSKEMAAEKITDAVALHAQIDEMTEEKFSTSKDILSRYSGRLKGFKFEPGKKIMNVSMAYSPEGEVVDSLCGDSVAQAQFDKFAGDMKVQPIKGKRGKMTFKNPEGKRVCTIDIDGFDDDPVETATTGAMRNLLKSTARGELRQAAGELKKSGAGPKEMERAKKSVEKAKDKFTGQEWEKLMKTIDEGKDVAALAEKLDAWPLLEAEWNVIGAKTAALRRIAAALAEAVMADRVAMAVLAARGFQVNRKDVDVMDDTGGSSKGPRPAPERNPPRDDVRKPFRTKNKTRSEKDPDTDGPEGSKPDKDLKLSFDSSISERELSRWPRRLADAVSRARVGAVLTEKDDLERAVEDAVRRSEELEFDYTTKSGAKSRRVIMPTRVVKSVGGTAVKGYETKDPAKVEKMFYLNMIGDVSAAAPVSQSSGPVAMTGRENPTQIRRILDDAVRDKQVVKFSYVVADGSGWKLKEKEGVPTKVGMQTGSGYRPTLSVWMANGDIIPLRLVGDFHTAVERLEQERVEEQHKKDEETRNIGDMMKKLLESIPVLGKYWSAGDIHKKDAIKSLFKAMSVGLSGEVKLSSRRDVVDGPYGAMEKTKVRDVFTVLEVRSGEPWDAGRCHVETREGEEYWVDDEGNVSRGGGGGGYSRRRRW